LQFLFHESQDVKINRYSYVFLLMELESLFSTFLNLKKVKT
jgi:hypothetical protein